MKWSQVKLFRGSLKRLQELEQDLDDFAHLDNINVVSATTALCPEFGEIAVVVTVIFEIEVPDDRPDGGGS